MKKGFRGTGTVERVDLPNKGIAVTDDGDRVIVKNTIPKPPIHCVIARQKRIPCGIDSMLFIMVAPVLLNPDIVSKKASVILGIYPPI